MYDDGNEIIKMRWNIQRKTNCIPIEKKSLMECWWPTWKNLPQVNPTNVNNNVIVDTMTVLAPLHYE